MRKLVLILVEMVDGQTIIKFGAIIEILQFDFRWI